MNSPKRETAACALVLFLLNIWIARELLVVEYVDHMSSIEGTHIALGRWVLENWRDLTWFPLWYGGIPYQNSYPPLHPFLTAAVAALTGFSPPRAYHALTGVLYALGPVTLFLLARKLCGSRAYAVAAGLLYSVLAPSSFLIPAVRNDSGGLWNARRLQALVEYGEGPHVGSMTLIPLALLLFIVALEKRRPGWWFLAALGLASVPLTNWLGALVLAVAVACWLLVEAYGWRRHLPAALLLGLWAYAIACRWIPPSTIQTVRGNEEHVSGELAAGRWFWAMGGVAATLVLLWVLQRLRAPRPLSFAVLLALPISLIPLASEWAGFRLMPQPHRYHLEMEMALVLVVVFAVQYAGARLKAPSRAGLAVAVVVLCVYPALRHRRYARQLIRPINIRTTIEYRVASWVDKNMDGRRVLLPGSIGFFLNAFTDTPQYAGGFDQGVVNPLWTHVQYQLQSGEGAGGEEGPLAIQWLKAFGVDAVGVSGPGSREAYKPFRNPKKFEGLLPVLWREDDDVIYSLNRRSPSLAHVIRREDLPPHPPQSGVDVRPLAPYLRALDDPSLPVARFEWTSLDSAVISARMSREQILSVQISHHPGWTASVHGKPVIARGDHLGQLVIEPQCDGECSVHLRYDGGLEMRAAQFISWTSFLGGIAWIAAARLRRLRQGQP